MVFSRAQKVNIMYNINTMSMFEIDFIKRMDKKKDPDKEIKSPIPSEGDIVADYLNKQQEIINKKNKIRTIGKDPSFQNEENFGNNEQKRAS